MLSHSTTGEFKRPPDLFETARDTRKLPAERYADAQGRISERSMIVEKLAAAGYWLPLGTVG